MDNQEMKQSNQENQKAKQIHHQQPPPLSGGGGGGAMAAAAAASPPSSASSPSHEFSFTISLHPTSNNCTKAPENNKTKPNYPPSSSLLDLSPADEIFFHGHLLPLHLLSHLPVSPRTSTNSIDNNSIPIKDFSQEKSTQNSKNNLDDENDDDPYFDLNHSFHHEGKNIFQEKPKSKSFSLFGLPKWKKGENKEDKEKQRKLKFDVSQVLKRYLRMVRPFLSFRSRKNMEFHNRQSYSYSGNLSFRRKSNNSNKEIRGIRRGAYSAPVSMKNSPTNSGLLVAKPTNNNYSNSSSSDSTMEELQAAIQAAIAHCKKSSSMVEKEKIQCQEND